MNRMSKSKVWQIMVHCVIRLKVMKKTSSNQPCGRDREYTTGAFLKSLSILKLGKCHLFRWIHTLTIFPLQPYFHLASETRLNLSTLHQWVGKNPLESYWGDYLVTFKGISQLKLVNKTITNKIYQDNIKSDIKLQYECTIPQAFNNITNLLIAL